MTTAWQTRLSTHLRIYFLGIDDASRSSFCCQCTNPSAFVPGVWVCQTMRAADLSISAGLCQAQQAVVVHCLLAPQIPFCLVQACGSFEGIPPALALLPHNVCELLQGRYSGPTEVQRAEHGSQARVCLQPQHNST